MNKNIRILVVDDFSTMRRIVKNLLSDLGFNNTVEAEDGHSALAVLRQDAVELVITDWNMPVMGGLDFVKALRANPQHLKTPILMVTTRSVKEDIMQAVEAGVSSYILKPFTPQVLKEKIDQILSPSGQP